MVCVRNSQTSGGGTVILFKKLKGGAIVRAAAQHNKRLISNELGSGSHIDTARSCLNYCLAGPQTPHGVADLARDRMHTAGVLKLRSDAVRAIEIVCSLPAHSQVDFRGYFERAVAWAAQRFGESNLLSADVHLDEGARHCHMLVLPLINGRMNGSAMVGSRETLQAHRRSYETQVMRAYGLALKTPRMAGAQKRAAARSIFESLEHRRDPLTHSCCFELIRAWITSDPAPWLGELGLPVPEVQLRQRKATKKTMTQIFTSPGKGPKRREKEHEPYAL